MSRQSSRKLWTAHLTGGSVPKAQSTPNSLQSEAPFRGLILGVDPSLRGMGIALVEVGGEQASLRYSNTLKLGRALNFYDCLGEIAQEMESLLAKNSPDHLAVEETIYVQNFRTAQILGAARGAALAAPTRRKIPVHEYAPLRIKQAVVGYGRASKEQVAGMICQLLKLPAALPPDESDAAAVALCHAYTWKG